MRCLLIWLTLFVSVIPYLQAQPGKGDHPGDIHFTVRVRIPGNADPEAGREKRKGMDSDQAILILPESYSKSGKPTRLIYVAHGAGGGVTANSWYLNHYALVDTLLANGYAVFDVNGGASAENMGGPKVVQSACKAYQYIQEHYNIDKEIFVLGLSMGGLSSANFVFENPRLVLAHALFSPVLDLYGQAWENSWLPSTRRAIAGTFDFNDKSGKTWEGEKVLKWNPMHRNNIVTGKDTLKMYPVPVKIWHGTGDKVVNYRFSANFSRYINRSGGNCELREIASDDHGLSCGNPLLNHELILFFRKYESSPSR